MVLSRMLTYVNIFQNLSSLGPFGDRSSTSNFNSESIDIAEGLYTSENEDQESDTEVESDSGLNTLDENEFLNLLKIRTFT